MKNKTITLVLTLVCVLCFCVNASATNPDLHIVTIENTDVIFSIDSTLTDEEKQSVGECIVYGPDNTQTYGLMCTLFGHKNTTEIVTTVTHCVNTAAPRCLEETWEVVVCSRCDHSETTRISHHYLYCCPES